MQRKYQRNERYKANDQVIDFQNLVLNDPATGQVQIDNQSTDEVHETQDERAAREYRLKDAHHTIFTSCLDLKPPSQGAPRQPRQNALAYTLKSKTCGAEVDRYR